MSIERKRVSGCRAPLNIYFGRRSLFGCGANTAAPVKKLRLARHHSTAVSLGTGSRPYCRLVLRNLLEQAGYPQRFIVALRFWRVGRPIARPVPHPNMQPGAHQCQEKFRDYHHSPVMRR